MNNAEKLIKGATTNVLDKGFIKVIDFMGGDEDVVDAARISYGSSSSKKSSTETLINYLMKHDHTSPFEMCEIKLHIKLPIFIARQWMRHRAGHFNEISGRYTEFKDDFYTPEAKTLTKQSSSSKQARSDELAVDSSKTANEMRYIMSESYKLYGAALKRGTAREVARIILPLSTYTEIFWKVDLHNFMKFIQLRIAENAQTEIQAYAVALRGILLLWCPLTHAAFSEFKLDARYFSGAQMKLIKQLLAGKRPAREDTGLSASAYTQIMYLLH